MRALFFRLYHDQRVRFLAVGGVNTVVGYSLFLLFERYLFEHVPFGYLASLALSYVFAIGLAFFLYRRIVFKVRGRVFGDLIRFIAVYLLAIGINAVALPLLVELVRLPPFLAQAIIIVCTTLLSFLGHKNVSFHRDDESQSAGTASQSR